VIIKQSL
jgi:calcium-dependent protein kinase